MMRLLKKVFSILVIFSLVLSNVSIVNAVESASMKDIELNYSNEINELKIMGIVDYDLQSETLITRGEYAHLLVRFLGVEVESLNEPLQLFYDVPLTHKYFQEISYCARQGYMVGYGNNIFQPDKKLVAEEIFKPIILALGYGYKATSYGGNMSAYIQAAKELGMLNGIDLPYGENLFHEEVAKILHNLLDTPVMTFKGVSNKGDSYEVDPDKTVLTEYHKKDRLTGVLKATDIAGVSGYSAVDEGLCIIDGIEFKFNTPLVRAYLGQKVDVLFSIDEFTMNEILICQVADDMNKVSILKEDVESFRAGSFVYVDENEKTRTLKVPLDFEFIYNGKNQRFDNSLIDDSQYGYFELLSSKDNSTYDIVMFYDYKTIVVDRVSYEREFIQGSFATEPMLNFDSSVYKTVFVDENGKLFDVKDLRKNDVITYIQNEDYIYGIVSRTFVSGEITEMVPSEYELFIDDAKYKLSGDKLTFYSILKINVNVNGYADCFGKLAGIVLGNDETLKNIYLPIKMYKKSIAAESYSGLKAYDFTNRCFKELLMEEIVTVDGIPYNAVIQYDTIEGLIINNPTQKPVEIKLSSKGHIKTVVLPKEASEFGENEDGFTTVAMEKSLGYLSTVESFYGETYTNSLTKFFVVPDDIRTGEEDEFYESGAPGDTIKRTVCIFSDSKDNEFATLVLFKRTEFYNLPTRPNTGIIKRITKVMNDEEELCSKVYVDCGGTEHIFYIDNPELTDAFQPAEGTYYYQPTIKAKDLKIGDVVSFALDGDGNLLKFNCHWKSETKSLKSAYQQFVSTNRYAYVKEVLGVSNDFLKIKLDVKTASKLTADLTLPSTSTKLDRIENLKLTDLAYVVVIRSNGTSYTGSIADVCIGDKLVIYSESYKLKRIYVIKD